MGLKKNLVRNRIVINFFTKSRTVSSREPDEECKPTRPTDAAYIELSTADLYCVKANAFIDGFGKA